MQSLATWHREWARRVVCYWLSFWSKFPYSQLGCHIELNWLGSFYWNYVANKFRQIVRYSVSK
jgi:hypothetical protein